MEINVPKGLVEDHKYLLDELEKAVKAGGKVGSAASELIITLKPHALHEEQFALPPLGLLPALTQTGNEIDLEMGIAVEMTNTLQAELPRLRAEHRAILAGVQRLSQAAQEEGNAEYQRLSEWLRLHIEEEEEVYYPAALLVGAFLKIKLAMVINPSFP